MQLNEAFSAKRLAILGVVALAFTMYVALTYGSLAVKPLPPVTAVPPQPRRGTIYDRAGRPLAMQVNFYHLAVRPREITDPEGCAKILAPYAHLSEREIAARITGSGGPVNTRSTFAYLRKKLTEQEYDTASAAVAAAKLVGVQFDRVPGRIYPGNALASQLVGFLGDDGEGLSGIEYTFQDILAPVTSTDPLSGRDGSNVYLTIDSNLQYQLEEIAKNALKTTGGETIMLVAAESKSGEILSYISLPSADLNNYTGSTAAERVDRPATVAYEPGSVFKIFTAAAYMDNGSLNDRDTFFCDGVYTIGLANGETITMNCLGKHGTVTIRRALELSCNDAIFQLSERLDSRTFTSKLRSFGFGSRTGIELPGETNGLLRTPDDPAWSSRSKPTIAIGQEVAVSALQVVEACTALTNGGTPVALTLVDKITNAAGEVTYTHTPRKKENVMSALTANYVLSYMETGVESGIGRHASLGDISIGVKTGTAQMIDSATNAYSDTDFLSDVISIFPIDTPVSEGKIILYIVLTKARGNMFASAIVAPVIAEAANTIIDHLGYIREKAPSFAHSGAITVQGTSGVDLRGTMPDLRGTPKRLLLPLLSRPDLDVLIRGDGYVTAQSPPPGTIIGQGQRIELDLD